MATKPDLARDVGKVEGSLSVLTKLSFSMIGLLGVVAAGGAAIYHQTMGLSNELGLVKREVLNVAEKVKKIDDEIAEVRKSQVAVVGNLGKIGSDIARLSPPPPLTPGQFFPKLNAEDVRTLWAFVGKDPKPLINVSKVSLGDKLGPVETREFPNSVIDKIPQLKGFIYTIGQDAILVLDSSSEGRIMAIVPPT